MFGVSFVELIVVALVVIFAVRPQDAPQIARSLGKIYAKIRHYIDDAKKSMNDAKKESGFLEVKSQFDDAVNKVRLQKQEKEQDVTKIVDLYGKTHYVPDIKSVRPDLDQDQLESEIMEENKKNDTKDKE